MSDLLNRTEAKLAASPVLLTGADGVVFANGDWTVTAEGLEHRNGYFIERDAVAQRRADGLWMWPLHIAEKDWCAPDTFREAFGAAVRAYGLLPDTGLALAFAEASEPPGAADRAPVYDLRRPPAAPAAPRQARRSGPVPSRPALADAA